MAWVTEHASLLIELIAVILIVVGIGMIYLPLAFICGGIGLLILVHVKEERTSNDYPNNQ